ncbi:hypothetical protein BDW22DRAFT_256428 [Trametopsis cervina]|nr:hypothetical protein BDW22DRAFT_256428 [Trametopsis cervina]
MRFSTVAATLLPIAGALATDFTVLVGDSGLDYNPSSVNAVPGDNLIFSFVAKNHTITQSSFADPCTKLSPTAIDSGFMFVSDGPLNFTIPVNDTNPTWFYCAQIVGTVNHCQSGMVFALNPTANKTYDAFKAAAQSLANSSSSPSSSGAPAPASSGSPSSSSSGSTPSSSGSPNGARGMQVGTAGALLVSGAGLLAGLIL